MGSGETCWERIRSLSDIVLIKMISIFCVN